MDYAKEIIRQGAKQIPTHSRQEHDAMIAERDRLLALASLWEKPEGELRDEPGFVVHEDMKQIGDTIRYVAATSHVQMEVELLEGSGCRPLYILYKSDLLATLPKEDAA